LVSLGIVTKLIEYAFKLVLYIITKAGSTFSSELNQTHFFNRYGAPKDEKHFFSMASFFLNLAFFLAFPLN